MACLRFTLDLAVPEDPGGTLILAVDGVGGIKLPSAFVVKIPAIKAAIQQLKTFSVNINSGQPNEEITTRAFYRICHHNEGEGHPVCEEAIEI